jgi:polyisoprenoid-binding protein YceI
MPAGTYVIDPHPASLIGSVSHFGRSTYAFRFDKFDASYDYDPAAPDTAKLLGLSRLHQRPATGSSSAVGRA